MFLPFEVDLIARLDGVARGAFENLEVIDRFPDPVSKKVVSILLQQACQSQHIGSINVARKAIARIPNGWLALVLDELVAESLDLSDEWEYRRLLELLALNLVDQLSVYIRHGIESLDTEICHAAEDYSRRLE